MHFRRPIALFALALITISTTGCKYILVPTYVAENVEGLEPAESPFVVFNDKSQILGQVPTEDGEFVLAYYQDGEVFIIPEFLNASPIVVGMSSSCGVLINYLAGVADDPYFLPAIYDEGLLSILPTPEIEEGEHYFYLLARSANGKNVGLDIENFEVSPATRKLVLWDDDRNYVHLELPNLDLAIASPGRTIFVNDVGTVVGSDKSSVVYMWRQGNADPETIISDSSTRVVATSLSDDDVVCGVQMGNGAYRAWVYDGTLHYLDSTLASNGVELATGMNDSGHIVGLAFDMENVSARLQYWKKVSGSTQYRAFDISEYVQTDGYRLSMYDFPRINSRGEILVQRLAADAEESKPTFAILKPNGFAFQVKNPPH